MKYYILVFTLSSTFSLINYCAENRMSPSELTPLTQSRSPYTLKPEREELLQETRDLPAWDGCGKRNSRFIENMESLVAPDKAYDTSCCTSIGMQQRIYAHGCTCEHPCVYTAASSTATLAATLSLYAISVNIAWPLTVFVGIPSAITACCAIDAAHNRCKSSSADQLDFITDQTNWHKIPESSPHDHNYESYDADWSGYDSG